MGAMKRKFLFGATINQRKLSSKQRNLSSAEAFLLEKKIATASLVANALPLTATIYHF